MAFMWLEYAEAEAEYTVAFSSQIGSADSITGKKAGEAVQLPELTNGLYELTGWKIGDTPVTGEAYTVSADDADANNTITLTAVWTRIDPGVPEFDMTGTTEVTGVPTMTPGEDFVFRIDMDTTANYLYHLTAGKELTAQSIAAVSASDTTLAGLITFQGFGKDPLTNKSVVEVTVHKELADYKAGQWDHLRFSFQAASMAFMWLEYAEA